MGRPFDFLDSQPIYGGFVYLSCPRWALGVNGQTRGTSPGNATEPHGALRNGKISELLVESGIPAVPVSAFVFLYSPPIYGGFVYLALPRLVLCVSGHPCGTFPGIPRSATER